MIRLDLQHGGQIRIWNQNLDFVKVTSANVIEETYFLSPESVNDTIPANNIIIAEIFLPRGGRNIYGLLGFEYKKTEKKELEILIPISNIERKRVFIDSLVSKFDLASVGLQDEYSKYIINALNEINKKNKFKFSGELNFCYAAFSEVSSSGWIFQKLTNILIRLLGTNLNEVTQEMIEDKLN
ncbi:MAG: hypothetical protein ACYC0J_10280 [Gammaproteobacteria bacterium]